MVNTHFAKQHISLRGISPRKTRQCDWAVSSHTFAYADSHGVCCQDRATPAPSPTPSAVRRDGACRGWLPTGRHGREFCCRSWAGARRGHDAQSSFVLVLGTHQKGLSINENQDFPQTAWMSLPMTSLGIPKMHTVKKPQPQNRSHFLFCYYWVRCMWEWL